MLVLWTYSLFKTLKKYGGQEMFIIKKYLQMQRFFPLFVSCKSIKKPPLTYPANSKNYRNETNGNISGTPCILSRFFMNLALLLPLKTTPVCFSLCL